jgi:hypothetical protein
MLRPEYWLRLHLTETLTPDIGRASRLNNGDAERLVSIVGDQAIGAPSEH